MRDVVFVTGNRHKAERYAGILGRDIEHVAMELDELQSTDLKTIAEHKARQAYKKIGRPVMIEDAGLFFNAFGKLPGPFIKFFIEEKNGLATMCRMLDGFSDRTAYSEVVICYYDGNSVTYFVGGNTGRITTQPKGEGGFGYDSIWSVDGYEGKTRAELTPEEELSIYISSRPVEEMKRFFND